MYTKRNKKDTVDMDFRGGAKARTLFSYRIIAFPRPIFCNETRASTIKDNGIVLSCRSSDPRDNNFEWSIGARENWRIQEKEDKKKGNTIGISFSGRSIVPLKKFARERSRRMPRNGEYLAKRTCLRINCATRDILSSFSYSPLFHFSFFLFAFNLSCDSVIDVYPTIWTRKEKDEINNTAKET